jgi:hypothetical protein
LTLLDKVLVMEDNKYKAFKALKLDETHALYFEGDELRCSRVYPTSESDFLHVEDASSRAILAIEVNVIDEAEQLLDIKNVILNTDITLHAYITKMWKYDEECSFGLIERGGSKAKRI